MSEITRREALTQLAAAFAAAGAINFPLARKVHAGTQVGAGGGPKSLTAAQFHTLERLVDLIIPADGAKPGALQAGVPAWIDALVGVNSDLESRYATGLGWLDATMTTKYGSDFAGATAEQQTALLDVIAFKEKRTDENAPGVDFFVLARRMTVDGFYTSDAGIREILPAGRPPYGEFVVPQEAIDYVISRSPFR